MYELLVLSLLMHWSLHAYRLAKIANEIIGPEEQISTGTLSSLLTKLVQAGLITPADPATSPFPTDRSSRPREECSFVSQHVLIVESRAIFRAGLRSILNGISCVTRVSEIATNEGLKEKLVSDQPDMILINQALVTDFKLLPRRHFSVLAATLNKDLLLAVYAAGGCSYLSEQALGELLCMTLCLPEEAFLLDPAFTSQMLLGSYFDSSLTVPLGELTNREREIFKLVCKGATNGAIADRLNISVATVKTHVAHILQKLGVKRRQVKVLCA